MRVLGVFLTMVPGVPLPPEIQLAQRLAGNEQVTRDRALRKLRKYIVARSQRATGTWAGELRRLGPAGPGLRLRFSRLGSTPSAWTARFSSLCRLLVL